MAEGLEGINEQITEAENNITEAKKELKRVEEQLEEQVASRDLEHLQETQRFLRECILLLRKELELLREAERLLSGAAANPGPSSAGAGGPAASLEPALKRAKMPVCTPSDLTQGHVWHACVDQPTVASSDTPAAFHGFRPAARMPAVIPAGLVAPEFQLVLDAAYLPLPPDYRTAHPALLEATLRLCSSMSSLHKDEKQWQHPFLAWHNEQLHCVRQSERALLVPSNDKVDGQLVCSNSAGKFVVSLLKCKSDVGTGEPMMQALRYYQLLYGDGNVWGTSKVHQSDPLPALLLLLEGPRLSIVAAWTIHSNVVAYAPLTPSYYLANECTATANVWRLVAVLHAYSEAVAQLLCRYTALAQGRLSDAVKRCAQLRVQASMRSGPCTLPYSLLAERHRLDQISFAGASGCLLYTARQSTAEGFIRTVIVKFVEGRYGDKVHRAWHAAGLAPELYSVEPLPHSGGYSMVVMEHLLSEGEGAWQPLHGLVRAWRLQRPADLEALFGWAQKALARAHALPLEGGGFGVHGDCRGPNILVREAQGGAPVDIRFIDFDWAGVQGEDKYPEALARGIRWHRDAMGGSAMHKRHDEFLLQQEFCT